MFRKKISVSYVCLTYIFSVAFFYSKTNIVLRREKKRKNGHKSEQEKNVQIKKEACQTENVKNPMKLKFKNSRFG